MSVEVKHTFQSAKGDGADTSLVKPSDWNAVHKFEATGPTLIGKVASGAGPVEEVPVGAGLEFIGGELVNTTKAFPVGVVLPLAGNSEPVGWFVCDGRTVSRSTYSALFAVTGDKFGVGDGTTTFNIPDMRGRVPAGKDNMGGTAANRLTVATFPTGPTEIGRAAGTERHVLLATEVPTHTHTLAPTATPHKHWVAIDGDQNDTTPSVNSTETVVTQNTAGGYPYQLDGATTPANVGLTSESGTGTHTHAITMSGTVDQPHLNLQPTMLLSFIVHHGVYP